MAEEKPIHQHAAVQSAAATLAMLGIPVAHNVTRDHTEPTPIQQKAQTAEKPPSVEEQAKTGFIPVSPKQASFVAEQLLQEQSHKNFEKRVQAGLRRGKPGLSPDFKEPIVSKEKYPELKVELEKLIIKTETELFDVEHRPSKSALKMANDEASGSFLNKQFEILSAAIVVSAELNDKLREYPLEVIQQVIKNPPAQFEVPEKLQQNKEKIAERINHYCKDTLPMQIAERVEAATVRDR